MDELLSLFGAANDDDDGDVVRAAAARNDVLRDAAGGGGTMPSHRRRNDDFDARAPLGTTTTTTTAAAAIAIAAAAVVGDPLADMRIVDRRTSRTSLLDAVSSFAYSPCYALARASRAEWNSRYMMTEQQTGGGDATTTTTSGCGGGGRTRLATCGILTSDVSSRLSAKTGRAYATMSLGDLPGGGGGGGGGGRTSSYRSSCSSASSSFDGAVRPSVTVFLFGDALSVLRSEVARYVRAGYAIAVLGPNLMPPRSADGGGGGGGGGGTNATTTSVTLSVDDPRRILLVGRAADCDRCRGTARKRTVTDNGMTRWEDVRCNTLVDVRLFGGYCAVHRRQGLSLSSSNNVDGGTNARRVGDCGSVNGGTFVQRQRLEVAASRARAGATVATNGGGGPGVPRAAADAVRRDEIVVRASSSSSSSSHRGIVAGGIGSASSLSEALSRSGLLGPAPTPSPTPTSSTMPSSSRPSLLKRAPLHMKKIPKESGATAMASSTTSASAVMNPYSKEKTGGRTVDDSGIADPTKRKRRSDDYDILGEALEGRKRVRSSRPSPANDDDEAPRPGTSRDDGRRPIVKVFNVEGYDGSVQVPKPSAFLFRATRTVVTPSPGTTCDRTQTSAAILERQKHLAELLRREGGNAAGIVSSTTGGARGNGFIRGGSLSRSKILSSAVSGRNPSHQNDDGRGNFASAFGGIIDDDDVVGPAGGSSLDRIASARSRFASAVEAREYARARGVVQALEAREARTTEGKEKGANDKKKGGRPLVVTAIVTSGWSCRSCKKTTPFKPASCIRAGHDVRQRRELKEDRSSANSSSLGSRKNRLDRHGRDDEEGGLTLGSGLEWSGWRGGFN